MHPRAQEVPSRTTYAYNTLSLLNLTKENEDGKPPKHRHCHQNILPNSLPLKTLQKPGKNTKHQLLRKKVPQRQPLLVIRYEPYISKIAVAYERTQITALKRGTKYTPERKGKKKR
jgi:predicted nucleic acid binding AN1-type Zn finger protein